ncbi:MAG: hypothetical protein AVDCRST_MAG49-3368 [uncultured Thermomicrobiales bacterium]|uniref:Uncharacterized protein n=1 Tax=uncultured Thermomicrobiales bacterium TaxID=1645740 RepID=A0A6J4V514_9BACT|nr:MAG: hypothetical protein AVDCRST_MAG49-3368 [uncultured Thermomicrobiales bacterium]
MSPGVSSRSGSVSGRSRRRRPPRRTVACSSAQLRPARP